jgi:hypothetical protein
MKKKMLVLAVCFIAVAFLASGCVTMEGQATGPAAKPGQAGQVVKPKPFKPPAPRNLELGFVGSANYVTIQSAEASQQAFAYVLEDVKPNTASYYAELRQGDLVFSAGEKSGKFFSTRNEFQDNWNRSRKGLETNEGLKVYYSRKTEKTDKDGNKYEYYEYFTANVSIVPKTIKLLDLEGVPQSTPVNQKETFCFYVTRVPERGNSIFDISEPVMVGDKIYAIEGKSYHDFYGIDNAVKSNADKLDTGLKVTLARPVPGGDLIREVHFYRAKVKF